MGIARLRISDAIRGKVDKPKIDALVDILSRAWGECGGDNRKCRLKTENKGK